MVINKRDRFGDTGSVVVITIMQTTAATMLNTEIAMYNAEAVTKSGRGRGIYMVPILTNKPTSAGGPTWARWPLTLCDTFITLTAFALSFNPMKIKGVTFLGKIKGAATPIDCARQGHLDDACAEL
jgi:hypothetical protein